MIEMALPQLAFNRTQVHRVGDYFVVVGDLKQGENTSKSAIIQ